LLVGEDVVELLHGDLAVTVSIEMSHQAVGFLVGDNDVHRVEASAEFSKVNHLITVFVKLGEQVNAVGLQAVELGSGGLDLSNHSAEGSFGENVTVILHVLLSVLVSGDQHELEAGEGDSAADHKVTLGVIAAGNGRVLLLAFHEATTNTSRVLVTNFVDLDGVVTAVERNDKGTGLIIGLGADELGVESKDVHVLLEHLLHVVLWWLGLKGDHGSHRVFGCTETSLWGHSLVEDLGGRLGELHGILLDVQVTLVPTLSEVVSVVDKALATPDGHSVSAEEVFRSIELNILHVEAGVVGQNGGHGQPLASKEHREGVLAVVGANNFLNLDSFVGEEVVATVVLITTIVAVILPHNGE